MKSYTEAIKELAELKQSSSFRYVCAGAFQLLAKLYEVPADNVYDDVAKVIDQNIRDRKRK